MGMWVHRCSQKNRCIRAWVICARSARANESHNANIIIIIREEEYNNNDDAMIIIIQWHTLYIGGAHELRL